ncbi:hypothetical protein ACF0H5_017084 [Mactra antiquata]
MSDSLSLSFIAPDMVQCILMSGKLLSGLTTFFRPDVQHVLDPNLYTCFSADKFLFSHTKRYNLSDRNSDSLSLSFSLSAKFCGIKDESCRNLTNRQIYIHI